jgi:chaperonin GroES
VFGIRKEQLMAKAAPKIRPLGEKVLIKRLEAEERTRGGIVLPDTAKEKPQKGKVLAVGDGKLLDNGKRAEFQVKKGDVVLFTSYAGTEIKVEGEEYLLMNESDIVAILD